MTAIDNRPTLHYPGDVRDAVGKVVGPTLAGELLVIDEVSYDEAGDTSTARLRYATAPEVDRWKLAARLSAATVGRTRRVTT